MDDEICFKIVLAVLFSLFTCIRAYYRRVTRPLPLSTQPDGILLRLLIPVEIATLFVHFFFPSWFSWAVLPLPLWLRWCGAGAGLTALPLLVWVHHALGANFSPDLTMRPGHMLVMHGPYRWARHPMYTAFYMIHIAAFLLTANVFIGLTWIGGLSLLVAWRLEREEKIMLEKFGENYRNYIKRTRRFIILPWI